MDAVAEHGKILKKHTLHVSADYTANFFHLILPYDISYLMLPFLIYLS